MFYLMLALVGCPGFHRYCRPCGPASTANSVLPKMTATNLWTGAVLPPVVDGLLSVGPLQGHDSALVLLTLAATER